MKRKAHGAQKPRHINRIVEVASTAQRSDSPAQAINQGFPSPYIYADSAAIAAQTGVSRQYSRIYSSYILKQTEILEYVVTIWKNISIFTMICV